MTHVSALTPSRVPLGGPVTGPVAVVAVCDRSAAGAVPCRHADDFELHVPPAVPAADAATECQLDRWSCAAAGTGCCRWRRRTIGRPAQRAEWQRPDHAVLSDPAADAVAVPCPSDHDGLDEGLPGAGSGATMAQAPFYSYPSPAQAPPMDTLE